MPQQLDSLYFGKLEPLMCALGTVTRLWDGQSGNHGAVLPEEKTFVSS